MFDVYIVVWILKCVYFENKIFDLLIKWLCLLISEKCRHMWKSREMNLINANVFVVFVAISEF